MGGFEGLEELQTGRRKGACLTEDWPEHRERGKARQSGEEITLGGKG